VAFCENCGKQLSDLAPVCPECGHPQNLSDSYKSPKEHTVVALLCFFMGGLGVHRFYVGKIATGLIQLFTLGLLGVWTVIDMMMLGFGTFTDSEGREIRRQGPLAPILAIISLLGLLTFIVALFAGIFAGISGY
jgi:hypothetical protein